MLQGSTGSLSKWRNGQLLLLLLHNAEKPMMPKVHNRTVVSALHAGYCATSNSDSQLQPDARVSQKIPYVGKCVKLSNPYEPNL